MLEDIIKNHLEFEKGAQIVVRGQENRQRRVSFLKGALIGNGRSVSRGLNARVRIGGSTGFASVGSYSEKDVMNVIQKATENAHFLDRHAPRKQRPTRPYLEKSGKMRAIRFPMGKCVPMCSEIRWTPS